MAMNLLDTIARDHANMRRLLGLFNRQLDAVEVVETVDYALRRRKFPLDSPAVVATLPIARPSHATSRGQTGAMQVQPCQSLDHPCGA